MVLERAGLTPEDDYAAAKPLMALRWEHSVVPCVEINQCVGCARRGTGIATPSSKRRVDGVEDDVDNAARAHRKLLIFTQVQTVEEPVLELEVPVADSTTMHVAHDAEHLSQ